MTQVQRDGQEAHRGDEEDGRKHGDARVGAIDVAASAEESEEPFAGVSQQVHQSVIPKPILPTASIPWPLI